MPNAWFGIFDRLPFATDITDSNNCLIYVNPAFEEFYGYPREKIIGLAPHFLLPDNIDRKTKQSMSEVLKHRRAWMGTQPNLKASGARVDVFLVALPIQLPERLHVGFLYCASTLDRSKELVLALLELMATKAFSPDLMLNDRPNVSPPGLNAATRAGVKRHHP